MPAGIYPTPQPVFDYIEVGENYVRLGARLTGPALEVLFYRRMSGQEQLVGIVLVSGPDCCEFIDTDVMPGEMYTYRFTAIRPDGSETDGMGGIVVKIP